MAPMPAKLAKPPAPARRNRPPSAAALIAWYERHARALPWRVGPKARAGGARPDPYRVWLSEVMLQQTTVKAVAPYFLRFVERWPTIDALADADERDIMAAWAGLGYYSRARKLIECARAVATQPVTAFPKTAEELAKLPGIGAYTSAAIAAIAFDEPVAVVDGDRCNRRRSVGADAGKLRKLFSGLRKRCDRLRRDSACAFDELSAAGSAVMTERRNFIECARAVATQPVTAFPKTAEELAKLPHRPLHFGGLRKRCDRLRRDSACAFDELPRSATTAERGSSSNARAVATSALSQRFPKTAEELKAPASAPPRRRLQRSPSTTATGSSKARSLQSPPKCRRRCREASQALQRSQETL